MKRRNAARVPALLVAIMIGGSMASPCLAGESAENFFPSSGVENVSISPDGKWIVAKASRALRTGILVQRVETGEISTVLATEDRISDLRWVDRKSVIATTYGSGRRRFMLIRFDYRNGEVIHRQSFIDAPGWLVDPRPLAEDEVVWALNYKGRASLRRTRLEELEAMGERRTLRGRFVLPGESLADLKGSVDRWVVDREGEARAARLVESDDDGNVEGYLIRYRDKGDWSFGEIYRFDEDDGERMIFPVTMTPDGKNLIVIAYNGRNTRGVHVFDPETGRFGETLFVREDVDVTRVVVDDTSHQLLAALYEVDGEERYQYLAAYGKHILSGLEKEFPKDSVRVVDISADRLLFVFRVADSTNPGTYYIRDVPRHRTTQLAQQGSNINLGDLSPVSSFVVDSADGTKIEAFLAVPKSLSGRPAPLIVMPHGGPIGVRDDRSYDAFVQYFASWGFAVLQPNYRGSRGYGLKFKNSGKKQWARGIEDDIDAAVEYATALPEVDHSRICIVGGSYGGFSALASIVRHEKRYACAISWNGVSDIPLLYDSSDSADSRKALEFFEEFVGDLETERDKLVQASPAYHADQIETPVFFIYGTEDRRVDPDHSHRMMLMLGLYGKEYESLEIEDMAHGYLRREGIIIARSMRRFVSKYLEPSRPYRRDPVTEADESLDFIQTPSVDF